jgi:7-cyano-7-deazaguanine synthase in queuosine biosynthesis
VTRASDTASRLDARRAEVLSAVATGAEATSVATHVGRILPWQVEGSTVLLRTELSGVATFVETMTFRRPDQRPLALDPQDPHVAGALDVLALTAALSYLKATLPPTVEVAVPLGPTAHRMLEALLTDGLAEFAYSNGLGPLDGAFDIRAIGRAPERVVRTGQDATAPRRAAEDRPGVLVTVGGGKDSAVTLALAARHDPDALALSVNPRGPMRATADWAGVGLASVERHLDARLLELNRTGALNGHVPITAIVMSAAAVAATALGLSTVLVSNESSADEPTRTVGEWRINHQFSKTSTFERLLVEALSEAGALVRIVSLLRPLSELAIARAAARLPGLAARVTSCNAAYSLSAPISGWCGDCDKCRFVQLALAPFMPRDALVADLGFDALADPAQVPAYAAMLDPATKPFECVGTVAEVRLALDLLAADPAWSDAAAVAALGAAPTGRSAARPGTDASPTLAARLQGLLAADPTHLPPPPFDRWLDDPEFAA